MIRSCGCRSPVQTAKLAGEPESACTLVAHYVGDNLKACNALALQVSSTISTNLVPPQYLFPGQPQEYLLLRMLPTAEKQALEQQFSEGMRLMPSICLCFSFRMASWISGSAQLMGRLKLEMDLKNTRLSIDKNRILSKLKLFKNLQFTLCLFPFTTHNAEISQIGNLEESLLLQNNQFFEIQFSMDANDHTDRLTQTRSSFGSEDPHWLKVVFSKLCPCLTVRLHSEEKSFVTKAEKTRGTMSDHDRYIHAILEMSDNSSAETKTIRDKKTSVYRSTIQRQRIPSMVKEEKFMSSSSLRSWHRFPISQLNENQIILIGNDKSQLFTKINSINLHASTLSKQKTKKSRTNMNEMYERYSGSVIDRFWNQRYLFFQKFDEGIKIDEDSWWSTPPQAVAQQIASKIRCQTILDCFCGVGSYSLKLANTCSHVICNDLKPLKLQFLNNNAKVYNVENIEIINNDFLTVQNLRVDVVFMAPVLKDHKSDKNLKAKMKDFSPPLHVSINKALQISKNIVLLLPANIDIHGLASSISQQIRRLKIMFPSCAMKIEKIFFESDLKYVAVYVGTKVDTDITLNDELNDIYQLLSEDKTHYPKKIIKKLRQQHGMINVLSYVLQSEDEEGVTKVQKFYNYIRKHQLIPEEKLEKMIQQNEQYYKKHSMQEEMVEVMEEEKYVDENTSGQRTVSYYSNYSGVSSNDRQTRKLSEMSSGFFDLPISSELRSSIASCIIQRTLTGDFNKFNEEIKEEYMEESNKDQNHLEEESHGEKEE